MKKETEGPRVITIGGRDWRVVSRFTNANDKYMLDAAAAAGMNIDAKNPEELVQRLMSAIVDGGHAPILLGGMLLPADVPDRKWRPRLAAATAEFMEELTDPEDKQLALILVAELIIDFFEGARALLGYFADVFRSVENLGVREPIAATS